MRNHRLQWIPVSVELTANLTNDEFFADANDERIIEPLVEFRLVHDSILTVRDELIFLLHTAAEVEHALMAQYLFAAGSIPYNRSLAATFQPALPPLVLIISKPMVLGLSWA